MAAAPSLAVAILTSDEIAAIVDKAVDKALASRREAPESDVLTREQVAALLQVHPRVVLTYVRTKGLPCVYVNRTPRFRRTAVLQWLEGQGK